MPKNKKIKKVLVIGSGPIVIGQAAEFDYSGTQACRVLKKEGIEVVLVNSNPATIMTDQAMADHIYLEPLTITTLKRIIKKEKPDSLLASIGGQTGLTIGMKLAMSGFLEEMNVSLIGSNLDAIEKSEDRQKFKETMSKINQPCIPSDIATTVVDAVAIASKIGYPVIARPAFTLGGAGSGVAYNDEELSIIAANGLMLSPITQILVEKYILGYKEIEFEVIRDKNGNTITVCSMENIDPVGVHTGDSIVIAPALTLADKEYQMLRSASITIINALGIEGGCNCQFALNPNSFEYFVIEVNPRVSRSSALASKATGYPIAKVATYISIGYTLDEIVNDITGKTYACFEPAIDYVALKMPKWPFDKFMNAKRNLGTSMKATGEVMAIGNNFESALMKAVRGAEIKMDSLSSHKYKGIDIKKKLHDVDDDRIFVIYEALKQGILPSEIHDITLIDTWFIDKINRLVQYEMMLKSKNLDEDYYIQGKKLGFLDKTIELWSNKKSPTKDASYKMVDTCAGEFKAETPYFYSTYDETCEAREYVKHDKSKIIVLGSGPIRIGQGIEFDYSSVHCVWTLKELGYEVIIINNNPETVSTDFDTADRLYFEPLTEEDVLNIIKVEKPFGVVVAFGGQTAIRLARFLDNNNINILGTSADSIDIAENRERFDKLLENFQITRPAGMGVYTLEEAVEAASKLGYPVLVRPSYVIGGQNMIIAYKVEDIIQYMKIILKEKQEYPILIDKYIQGIEIEIDAISDGDNVLIPSIMQHIERAGVHSGDSITVYPSYNIDDIMLKKIVDCSKKIALALKTKGLINIQYVIANGVLYVIEVNPRASRTIPYISKVSKIPMVDIATKIMMGEKLNNLPYGTGLARPVPYFSIKVPVFSFEKLSDANSLLGPEMKSTGEVLGIGKTIEEAMYKGLIAAGFKIHSHLNTEKGIFISVNETDRLEVVKIAKKFYDLGLKLYATKKTAEAIIPLGVDINIVEKPANSNQVSKLLENGKLDYILYTCDTNTEKVNSYIALHQQAIRLGVACLTSLDTANALADILASRFNENNTELVDINNMREERLKLEFVKMEGTGNDYIFFNNFANNITCPESLAVTLTNRAYSIGGSGIVLIEKSEVADAKMRIFNMDGSEGEMAGNAIRCVVKYLFDNNIVLKDKITIETKSGIKALELFFYNNKVSSVTVDMGKAILNPLLVPVNINKERVIDYPIKIDDKEYKMTCISMGNPHCSVFLERIDLLDLEHIGPLFENNILFPERVNTEFIRVINKNLIEIRVWERGNGETMACGTGACAAVVASVLNGYANRGEDIAVRVKGGTLIVNYTDEKVTLNGTANLVYTGLIEN